MAWIIHSTQISLAWRGSHKNQQGGKDKNREPIHEVHIRLKLKQKNIIQQRIGVKNNKQGYIEKPFSLDKLGVLYETRQGIILF